MDVTWISIQYTVLLVGGDMEDWILIWWIRKYDIAIFIKERESDCFVLNELVRMEGTLHEMRGMSLNLNVSTERRNPKD